MSGPRLDADQRELLDRLFDKWTLVVLDELCAGPRRFSELRRDLDPITPRALSAVLKSLALDGLVARTVSDTAPVAVTYTLTTLGRSLEQPMQGLLRWVAGRALAVAGSAEG